MEWKKCYLDVILVPIGCLICIGYHVWLWHKVRTQPLTTTIGTNAAGRRLWVSAIMKDNEKKNILAVQTLRNTIMGSTLMATTSILLSSGLAAVISSTYSIKKPLNDAVYGAHGEFMVALNHSLSIRFINQVNFLINCPPDSAGIVCPEYVSELLEKGLTLNTAGNRLFYGALPLMMWIFGPIKAPIFRISLEQVVVLLQISKGENRIVLQKSEVN
nr:uncharacterized protein LOC109172054 [Ipomoea batatas]